MNRIEMVQRFDGEVGRVYRSMLEPDRWLADQVEVDIDRNIYRFGGRFVPPSIRAPESIVVERVVPNESLRLRWPAFGNDSTVDFRITEVDGRTELRLTHAGLAPPWELEGHITNVWALALVNLR